jgi:hypothetical protein
MKQSRKYEWNWKRPVDFNVNERLMGIIKCEFCTKYRFKVLLNKSLKTVYEFQGDILVTILWQADGPTKIVMRRNRP